MAFARNDGVRIHYEVEGDGPALVLHHGFSGSLRHWYMNGYVEALRHTYRLILVDARGHGESDKPHDSASYALDTRVQDVFTILDELGVDRTLWCGFSMGGNVVYGALAMAPQRIQAAAILAADPFPYNTTEWNTQIAWLEQGMEHYADQIEATRDPYPAEERAQLLENDPAALIASKQDTRDWPGVADGFRSITVPTLLIGGESDPLYPLITRAAESNPQAAFISLPGIDHINTLRRSDLTLPHVEPFLARAEVEAASPSA